jgi:hypothetical protein
MDFGETNSYNPRILVYSWMPRKKVFQQHSAQHVLNKNHERLV